MFGRSRTTETEADEARDAHAEREGAKNRPTPKRRDQEAARRRPLVVTDRKEAKRVDKEQRREQMARRRRGMETGEEKFLPTRDRGPQRRFIRDYVDARRNLGEYLLPAMLIVLAVSIVTDPTIRAIGQLLTWLLVLVVVVDTAFMWRACKKALVAKFGADGVQKGSWGYAAMRVFQMRRQRLPKPQVERGQYPS
ncbi:DUF3043 domain-containing protein [Phycicoccus flavus]|uniref:DUF3043 domain-containing protein n=1 Tax=Phycicoccus flavus TaxID=2502783 RepID=UPI000FEB7984|nr:DUF3043 domain-containing protein [Phycicoccus flavus]NHA67098.1 DUF3043 domain-containing protein [Phycicoccus flavus]